MTHYNVETDLEKWAMTRVKLWDEAQRDAIRKEFARLDREFHGKRIAVRAAANHA